MVHLSFKGLLENQNELTVVLPSENIRSLLLIITRLTDITF
jgi:hypothetical protein